MSNSSTESFVESPATEVGNASSVAGEGSRDGVVDEFRAGVLFKEVICDLVSGCGDAEVDW